MQEGSKSFIAYSAALFASYKLDCQSAYSIYFTVTCTTALGARVSEQFADKPTHRQSTC